MPIGPATRDASAVASAERRWCFRNKCKIASAFPWAEAAHRTMDIRTPRSYLKKGHNDAEQYAEQSHQHRRKHRNKQHQNEYSESPFQAAIHTAAAIACIRPQIDNNSWLIHRVRLKRLLLKGLRLKGLRLTALRNHHGALAIGAELRRAAAVPERRTA